MDAFKVYLRQPVPVKAIYYIHMLANVLKVLKTWRRNSDLNTGQLRSWHVSEPGTCSSLAEGIYIFDEKVWINLLAFILCRILLIVGHTVLCKPWKTLQWWVLDSNKGSITLIWAHTCISEKYIFQPSFKVWILVWQILLLACWLLCVVRYSGGTVLVHRCLCSGVDFPKVCHSEGLCNDSV